jgi:Na+-translocating ferredoxin:NAD+ oxidoreductase RNF subunit RnfB
VESNPMETQIAALLPGSQCGQCGYVGCEKCFEVCPTEAIEMRRVIPTLQTWSWPHPDRAAA